MTINPALLIAAPMLQDYLVDKDTGMPLVNGFISMYNDNSRSFYKNWYYQSSAPGAYTWIPLDNPLTLSSVGTIQDPQGNDVIPFYYPFDENNENSPQAYYVTVYSSDGNGNPAVLQFTRENFPYVPAIINPETEIATLRNYILNNVYWRNIGSLNTSSVLNQIIAPSQHEGYTNGDIRFIKNISGATDSISFLPMTETLSNDITPEYYLNYTCTAVQTGETQKIIQYPVSLHIATLANEAATLTIQAQNVAGNANNYIDIYLYQFLGTGAISQPPPVFIQRITLGNTFQKWLVPITFPNNEGLVLGAGGDDALFIQVQYPLSAICSINHTKPSIYLSDTIPNNDFDTYDQIETIINSPRTGDGKISYNSFQPFGYVQINDGSIGDAASDATARANIDTWPLFLNMYLNVSQAYAPVSDGRTSPGNTVAAAYADWIANKTLTLPVQLGRMIGVAGAGAGLTSRPLGDSVGAETISIAAMPSHNHPGSTMPAVNNQTTIGAGGTIFATGANTPISVAAQGGGAADGNMPPATFWNVFLKL